jgi:hypothetical protein
MVSEIALFRSCGILVDGRPRSEYAVSYHTKAHVPLYGPFAPDLRTLLRRTLTAVRCLASLGLDSLLQQPSLVLLSAFNR